MPTVPKDESRVPMTPNQTVGEDFKTMAFGLMRRSQEVEDFTGWKGYLSDVLPKEAPPQGELSETQLANQAGIRDIDQSQARTVMGYEPSRTGPWRDLGKPQFLTGGDTRTTFSKDKQRIEDIRTYEEPNEPFRKTSPKDEIEDRFPGSKGEPTEPGTPVPDTQRGSRDVRVAGGSDSVWRSIFQQESSSGKDLRTSATGAIGPGQIMPGTFKQWAKPGENIRNDDDNIAVSKRMVESYHKQYGGDPARVAVAYFSGPGNVAPAGSPTPWKVDKSDGTVRTSQYVQQVIGRMGGSVDAAGVPQARSRGEVWDKAGRYVGGTEETPRFKPDTSWLDAIVNARRGKRRTA